ncbi:hypothetical protein ACFQ0T_30610 [Kitasatospora gansuensis]
MAEVHARGLVLRDLSPGNVMVRPDGSLRLVDLELAAAVGATVGTAGTPGYRAPEQEPAVCQAGFGADLYALGGLFFLLATGHDPLLPPGEGSLEQWLAAAGREGETARRLAPLVLGLRSMDPALRQLPSTEPFLTSFVGATPLRSASPFPEPLVVDGLAQLAATATPERADRLWATVPGGS